MNQWDLRDPIWGSLHRALTVSKRIQVRVPETHYSRRASSVKVETLRKKSVQQRGNNLSVAANVSFTAHLHKRFMSLFVRGCEIIRPEKIRDRLRTFDFDKGVGSEEASCTTPLFWS